MYSKMFQNKISINRDVKNVAKEFRKPRVLEVFFLSSKLIILFKDYKEKFLVESLVVWKCVCVFMG